MLNKLYLGMVTISFRKGGNEKKRKYPQSNYKYFVKII